MKTSTRCLLTLLVLAVAWVLGGLVASGSVQAIGSAELAGLQMRNSDVAAVAASTGIGVLARIPWWVDVAAAAAIAWLWWRPAMRRGAPTLAVALAVSSAWAMPARAYFSTTDKTEAVTIMPNESAFWIPDVGANRDSQASLDSEAYFAANKVSLKRFVIPHVKLANTGGWIGFDSYVPGGRMIIVDRAPYYREWTREAARGRNRPGERPAPRSGLSTARASRARKRGGLGPARL